MDVREYSLDEVIKYNPLFAHQTWASKNRDAFFCKFINAPNKTINEITHPLEIKKLTFKDYIKIYIPTSLLKILYRIK